MDEQQLALVIRAKKGDSAAFGELYEGYANELYRFALYMVGRPEDAEDAVQDAVISAWQNLPSLRDNALFKPWLFKVLSNTCKTALAKRGKQPALYGDDEAVFLLTDGSAGYSFQSAELKEAIASLGEPDARLILLSVLGGFKSNELAVIFDMVPATVRSRQKRALEKLRAVL
ncbi:MAG: RNA polymerase sigma factor [Clostridia bacterium]|nr:RNA polymerase sigma factor [Clostridia bacterium]